MKRYSDMLHLPHHVSPTRARMSVHDRAAQFAPFAALTGYGDMIVETGRVTETSVFLTDSAVEELDRVLQALRDGKTQSRTVRILYFQPDERKKGGAKCTLTALFRKVDDYRQMLLLEGDREVPLGAILEMEILDKQDAM